ncbi:MAG: peptide chain release factor N(5)-glutamine methyltransferase [Clostridia bacterium]
MKKYGKEEREKNINLKVGGMALFNGLMLRNNKREAVVEFYDDEIFVHVNKIDNDMNSKKFDIKRLPIIRGILGLIYTISSSVPYIMSSAQNFIHGIAVKKKDKSIEENIEIDTFEIACGYVIAITIILSVFTLIPNLIATFFPWNLQNIVQCIIQLGIIALYLTTMAKASILKVLFEYHGSEHKVVNAYENLELKDITLENVKKESRFHIRCGGNFVVYLFLMILITTLIIPPYNILFKSLIQIVLLPVFVGLAYEIIMVSDKLPGFLKYLAYPAMAIQYITTKEPTDEKIQLAIYALFACINENKPKTIKTYLNEYFTNIDDYVLDDAMRIIASVKNINKDKLFIECDTILLSYDEQIKIDRMLNKMYSENIPLQYILGKQPFYNEEYIVTSDVLIPRADSEILVDSAIKYINKYNLKLAIDMCTGSGCIGISIAKNSNISQMFLCDISTKALAITIKNMNLNGVYGLNNEKKVFCIKSDMFEIFLNKDTKYDIIVSNPPYIPTHTISTLSKQVQNQPFIALDGGINGIYYYDIIYKQAIQILKNDGYILVEIGFDELDKVKNIVSRYREYEIVECVKDLGGNDRVIICRFHQM